MEDLDVVQFVQRAIKERRTVVMDTLEHNGIRDMAHYQFCMGEISALSHIAQELSGLLEKQEQMND